SSFHNSHQKDNNDQIRNTADDLQDTHHNRIHRTAEVSGNTTVENTYETVDKSHGNSDSQRNPGAVPYSCKYITAQIICSENMHLSCNRIRGHDRFILKSNILLFIAKRTYHRKENSSQYDQCQNRHTDNGHFTLPY